jgi:hypothetical protein
MMVEKNTDAYAEMKATLNDLLHEGVVTVTFQKESTGSCRDMVCTLDPDFLPPAKPLKDQKRPARRPNPDTCVVYDLERKDWRSFRFDTVIQFKTINGVYIPKDVRVSTVEFIPSED